jgi:hypothetical protein
MSHSRPDAKSRKIMENCISLRRQDSIPSSHVITLVNARRRWSPASAKKYAWVDKLSSGRMIHVTGPNEIAIMSNNGISVLWTNAQ